MCSREAQAVKASIALDERQNSTGDAVTVPLLLSSAR